MIDTHCHLADSQFDADLPAVLARAKEKGIDTMIIIADSVAESERCVALAAGHSELFCTIGVHPHNAKEWTGDTERRLLALSTYSKKVKAIGEIGLDYHYDFSPRDIQRQVFMHQLRFAGCEGLPVVVHCREAIQDIRDSIADIKPKKLVLHCCTERFEDVKPLLDAGYFLSFTGIATFPKAADIRETIRQCPLEQLMIETDSPYLAPVPYRGKRNEPAYVVEVAECIAQIKGLSLEEVAATTTQNAVEFFGLD
ncbi:MAG: TatD DNase family protein [Candidatus Peribacteria bacterium]|nr:TatD DNase family protein [Candidatus Peribacteria bacterium]